jgi:hypothetical protein
MCLCAIPIQIDNLPSFAYLEVGVNPNKQMSVNQRRKNDKELVGARGKRVCRRDARP